MSSFDNFIKQYRVDVLKILEEQPAPSGASTPEPAAPSPSGDPSGGDPSGAADTSEPKLPNPEDVVNELEKTSKKPWVDLAGVLSRAMEYHWTDADIKRINGSLPGGLTIRDFIDVRTSPQIKDKYDSNIISASVSLFDQVDKLMGENDMDEIVPAEER